MFQGEYAWGYGLPQRRQYEEPETMSGREREHQLQGVLHRAWGYGLQPQRLVAARENHPQIGFTQQSVAQDTCRPPRRKKRGFEHKERRDSRPCRYYNKPGGCRKGSQCSFYHDLGSKAKERGHERMAEAEVGREEDAFAVKPILPVTIEKDVSAQTLDATSSSLPGQSPVHHDFQSGKVTLSNVDIAHDIKEQNLFEMAWMTISKDDKRALVEFAKGNLNLQMFDSKVPLHRQIPMVKGKPSLLMYGLDESLGQESQEILERAQNAGNVLLLGTSGCGKTRCLYELLAKNFGLYLVAGTMGNGGSQDVETLLINIGLDELEKRNIEDPMKRESFIKDLTSILLWARLEVLNFCLEQNHQFSPYQWLLCQLGYATVGVDIFGNLCIEIYRLWVQCRNLSVLPFQFKATARTVVEQAVRSKKCESKIFLTVLDEAQVLFHHGVNKFPSHQNPGNVRRTLFSPVFKALQAYHHRTGCVLTSGTSMGLVTQMEASLSGIAKANQGPLTFTTFRGWLNSEHVRSYLHTFMDISIEDCASLFETFRGRYRPLVSCIEEVLSGKTIDEAKQSLRLGLTRSKQHGSFYNAFARLADGTRTGKVNVIVTLTSALFHFLYTGGLPYPVRDKHEMQMIEYGIGRIVPLDEDSPVSQEPSSLLLRGFSNAEMVHVCIDEPLAIEALKNFCIDEGLLEQKWHDALRSIPSKSSRGFAWERFVKSDFEKMFGASVPLCSHPLFQGLDIKHSRFQQPVKIVTPNEKAGFVAEVTYSTDQYSLDDYLSSDPEKSSPFFVCDQHAGPDVCFRVRFADGSVLPAFGQFKLRVDVTRQDLVVETTNPHNFYTYINKEGKRTVRKNRRREHNNILKACMDGLLRFVIMYPAKIRGITSLEIEVDGEIGPQLLGVVGAQNADSFLDAEHILFLKNLCYD